MFATYPTVPGRCALLHDVADSAICGDAPSLVRHNRNRGAGVMQAEAGGKEERLFVVKDDSQPRCAFCNEPFEEEWDEDLQVPYQPMPLFIRLCHALATHSVATASQLVLHAWTRTDHIAAVGVFSIWCIHVQEWVYVDAVRVPKELAELDAVNVPPGSIVKAGLLGPDVLKELLEFAKQSAEAAGSGGGDGAGGVKRKAEWGAKMEDAGAPLAQLARLAQPAVKQEAT